MITWGWSVTDDGGRLGLASPLETYELMVEETLRPTTVWMYPTYLYSGEIIHLLLLMAEILHHLNVKNLVNEINDQPQLVSRISSCSTFFPPILGFLPEISWTQRIPAGLGDVGSQFLVLVDFFWLNLSDLFVGGMEILVKMKR